MFSVDLNSPPIGDVTNIEQVVARLSDFALKRAGGWVVGHGYDDTLLREKRHLTAKIWTGSVEIGLSRWFMCLAILRWLIAPLCKY